MLFITPNGKSSNIKLHDFCWSWKWKMRIAERRREIVWAPGLTRLPYRCWQRGGALQTSCKWEGGRTQLFLTSNSCCDGTVEREGWRWTAGNYLLHRLAFSFRALLHSQESALVLSSFIFLTPNFCCLPRIYFIWHLGARFLKLLTDNLHFTFCWHWWPHWKCCVFLGRCVMAVMRGHYAICSVTKA